MEKRGGLLRSRPVDAALVAALLAVAAVARWGYLQPDGLHQDDAWVYLGATRTRLTELLSGSTNHPGFTLMIRLWAGVDPTHSEHGAIPVMVFGIVTPAVLYVLLRQMGVSRPASLVPAGLLCVAPLNVVFAGRIKPYVLEVLAISVVGFVVVRLSARRWTAKVAVAWVAFAVVLGTLSIFVLLAGAVGGVLLVVHAREDRSLRARAVAVQAVIQAGYFAWIQRSFDSKWLADFWATYDSYVELQANPVDLARELGLHFGRVGGALVGDGGVVSLLLVLVGLAGLLIGSWRGERAVLAQLMLSLVVVGFVGSVLRQVPFGPVWGSEQANRASIWLSAPLLVGLALALDLAVDVLGRRTRLREPVLLAASVVGVLAIVAVLIRTPPDHPVGGMRSAQASITREYRPGDLVIVFPLGLMSYSAEPDVSVDLQYGPDLLQGIYPVPTSPATWVLGGRTPWDGSLAAAKEQIGDAPRVFVHDAPFGFGDQQRPQLESVLAQLGFQHQRHEVHGMVALDVWARAGA